MGSAISSCFSSVKDWCKCGGKSSSADDDDATSGPESTIVIRSSLSRGDSDDIRVPHCAGNDKYQTKKWVNSVKTSQYTWWNFIFLNLFQQCILPANLYFIVMAILQLIPAISDSGGIPTFLMPICFVFAVTMVKDGYEDMKRHKSDHEENTRKTLILNEDGSWKDSVWADVRPGDIVKVLAEEIIPADLSLLSCADETGVAYVETVQLDGETNLKTKISIPELVTTCRDPAVVAKMNMELCYGPPSAKLYSFNGLLRVYPPMYSFPSSVADDRLTQKGSKLSRLFSKTKLMSSGSNASRSHDDETLLEANKKVFPLALSQFLWRGAKLRNTAWAVGIALYTGRQTRIFMNTRDRPVKYSTLMKTYNRHAIILFILEAIFCLVAAILFAIDVKAQQQDAWYLMPEEGPEYQAGVKGFFVAFGTALGRYTLLMSYFVPITLLIQVEIAHWFQGYYLHEDAQLVSSVTEAKATISSVGIVDDLGNITHVFSDKTGTLTQNIMQLKCLAVGPRTFGFDEEEEILEVNKEIQKAEAQGKAFGLEKKASKRMTVKIEKSKVKEEAKLALTRPAASMENTTAQFSKSEIEVIEKDFVERVMRVNPTLTPNIISKSPNRYVDFVAPDVRSTLLLRSSQATRHLARDFLLTLALCHTVLPKPGVVCERFGEPTKVPFVKNDDGRIVEEPSPDLSLLSDSIESIGSEVSSEEEDILEEAAEEIRLSLQEHESMGEEIVMSPRVETPASVTLTPVVPLEEAGSTIIVNDNLLSFRPTVEHQDSIMSESPLMKSCAVSSTSEPTPQVSRCIDEYDRMRDDTRAIKEYMAGMKEYNDMMPPDTVTVPVAESACGRFGVPVIDVNCTPQVVVIPAVSELGGTTTAATTAVPDSSSSRQSKKRRRPLSARDERRTPGTARGTRTLADVLVSDKREEEQAAARRARLEIRRRANAELLGETSKRDGITLASFPQPLWTFQPGYGPQKLTTQLPPRLISQNDPSYKYTRQLRRYSSTNSSTAHHQDSSSDGGRCSMFCLPNRKADSQRQALEEECEDRVSIVETPKGNHYYYRRHQTFNDGRHQHGPRRLTTTNYEGPVVVDVSPEIRRGSKSRASDVEILMIDRDVVDVPSGGGILETQTPMGAGDKVAATTASTQINTRNQFSNDVTHQMNKPEFQTSLSADSSSSDVAVLTFEDTPMHGAERPPLSMSSSLSDIAAAAAAESVDNEAAAAAEVISFTTEKEQHSSSLIGGSLVGSSLLSSLGSQNQASPARLTTASVLKAVRVGESPTSTTIAKQGEGMSPISLLNGDVALGDQRTTSGPISTTIGGGGGKMNRAESVHGVTTLGADYLSGEGNIYSGRICAVRWNGQLSAGFDAASPDELALVAGAKHLGMEFLGRPDLNTIEIGLLNQNASRLFLQPGDLNWIQENQDGILKTSDPQVDLIPAVCFEVLDVLDFDNVRKRMSVIIRDRDGKLRLLCKGADTSMLAIAAPGQSKETAHFEDVLADFARDGLRTLVFGIRYISESEYQQYSQKVNAIKAAGGSEEKIAEVFLTIEKGLTILGCSAIDDKLQDEVPQTIEALKDAGIRVWVLTGDKVETAISIGHSCNLLSDNTFNAIIDGHSPDEVKKQMHDYMSFTVAGQLAREAFDQILVQEGGGVMDDTAISFSDSDDDKSGCGHCWAKTKKCCTCASCRKTSKGEELSKETKRVGNKRTAETMSVDDFVRILTFNARHKKVVAANVDGGNQGPRQLGDAEVEALVALYLECFDQADTGTERKKRRIIQHRRLAAAAAKTGGAPLSAPTTARDNREDKDGDSSHTEKMLSSARSTSGGQGSRIFKTSILAKVARFATFKSDAAKKYPSELPLSNQVVTTTITDPTETRLVTSVANVEKYDSVALTITGEALQHALSNEKNKQYLFGLAHLCSAVIACRVTPKQKAEVVKYCGECTPAPTFTSLGIGDGANDVGMILTAHVGVGIAGKEGMQAARSADIAIGEFKLLKNLLFCHGHWDLRRNAIMVYHTIYKNVAFALGDFFVGFYSGFSAADIYDAYLKQVLNLLFTPWCIMSIAVFDRFLPYDILLQCPPLYPIATRPDGSAYFGKKWFFSWSALAFLLAFIGTLFPLFAIKYNDVFNGNRTAWDYPSFGQTVFFQIVTIANFCTIPFTHTVFWFTWLAFILSYACWYFCWWIVPVLFVSNLGDSIKALNLSWLFHFIMILGNVIVCGVLFIWWRWKVLFSPTPDVIIRERVKKGVYDVIVAPKKKTGDLSVVVPPQYQTAVYKGFASTSADSRFMAQRRTLSKLSSSQSENFSSSSITPANVAGPISAPSLSVVREE